MILYIALAFLLAWVLGVLGVLAFGQLVHVLLLVGLLLLLTAFMKARDTAMRQPHEGDRLQ